MRKILCMLGFHKLTTIESVTFDQHTRLNIDDCKYCGIRNFCVNYSWMNPRAYKTFFKNSLESLELDLNILGSLTIACPKKILLLEAK